MNKGGTVAPSRGSTPGSLPGSQARTLPTRSDITLILSGDSGPVGNIADARKWLANKSWIYPGEPLDRKKLVNILLTTSCIAKLPSDAAAAIRAVAFLLEDDINDAFSSLIASSVTDKLISQLNPLTTELSATKSFLEATSAQQATLSISLQEVASHHSSTSLNLAEIAEKLKSSPVPSIPSAPPTLWPSLPPPHPAPSSLPSNKHNPASPTQDIRLQQRVLLAARTVLVQIDLNDESSPKDRSPLANSRLRVAMNNYLDKQLVLDRELGFCDEEPKKTSIRGIQTLDRGAYLFELDSPSSADRFRSQASFTDLLTSHLGESATVKPKGHNLVFSFVPCDGAFDPSDALHIAELEKTNFLPPGAITSASWLKRADRRSPGQTVASLKVVCSSPEHANHLLCERIYVAGRVVSVRKDLREPIRCNKCQEFGHI